MAQAPGQATPPSGQGIGALARGFGALGNAQKVGLAVALAAAIALVVVAFLWARTAEYRVLYSNLSDRDGGEVIAALAQQNVPYHVAEGGSVILVPATRSTSCACSWPAQGLPKGGAVGFELMDTQKFGMSQFGEQVNYQRALAGELSRTIQSIAAVQGARVHLAIPRPTVFVRDRQRPSASVLVSLYPGRMLDAGTGQRDPASGRQQRAGAGSAQRHRGRPGRQSAVRNRSRSARYGRPGLLAAQVSARRRGELRRTHREHPEADRRRGQRARPGRRRARFQPGRADLRNLQAEPGAAGSVDPQPADGGNGDRQPDRAPAACRARSPISRPARPPRR